MLPSFVSVPPNHQTVSPEELSSLSFSPDDAVLVTDKSQIEFLSSRTNASFHQCLLLPLSLQAYAASIRVHSNVRSYFDLIDFESCKQSYRGWADQKARRWLSELGLRLEVEGIDMAEFDAASQFLFFHLGYYLENAVAALNDKLREIKCFYLVSSAEPLPLEFYFDSDVPTAILRFALEQRGRCVRTILYGERKLVFPWLANRPLTKSSGDELADTIADNDQLTLNGAAVGFGDASVINSHYVLRELRALNRPVMLFRSTWGRPITFGERFVRQYQLSDRDRPETTHITEQVQALWRSFRMRRDQSTLLPCLIRNPYLDFQWEYIITKRWLSYANMIFHAKLLAAQVPLRLFVHSEVFTAEGVILAHFYRRANTKILLVPHSQWPCDRNWGTWTRSDHAVVFSRGAARRLRQIASVSKVHLVESARSTVYRSLVRGESKLTVLNRIREGIGGRKAILVVTNALELLTVPFTNLEAHFRTLSVLARIPDHLQGKVVVAIKTKPGALGEDPILYSKLCGFSDESISLSSSLNLSDCLAWADCAVGINVPTNGYYEVIERGVPLLHIQTAEAVTYHPELPGRVVKNIVHNNAIWPAIDEVLFGSSFRQRTIQKQRRFIESEQKNRFWLPRRSLQSVLDQLSRPHDRFKNNQDRFCLPPALKPGINNDKEEAGYIDDIIMDTDGNGAILGWAADKMTYQPAKAVHVYAGAEWLAAGRPQFPRPDVARVLEHEGFTNAGFAIEVPGLKKYAGCAISAYAELSDGSFRKLMPTWAGPNETINVSFT